MASLRSGTRRDGSTYVQVLYRLNGKQSSTSFEDLASATKFQKLVEKFGPAKALETLGTDPEFSAITVGEWIEHHIDHLTGLRKSSLYDYRSYLKNDIDEALGDLPLISLSRDDIARWMQGLSEKGSSGKTIANKHGFLSSALNAAVRAGRIPSNPAAGQRLPSSERQEMVCLSQEDFARLLDNVTEFWRPLVEFLVASGCRWGEATALKPAVLSVRSLEHPKRYAHGRVIGMPVGTESSSSPHRSDSRVVRIVRRHHVRLRLACR